MSHIIIAIVAVLAIAHLSIQAYLPYDDEEPLNYSVTNLSPDDAQNIDFVWISDSNRYSENISLNSSRIDVSSWPNYIMGSINLNSSSRRIDTNFCLQRPFFCCRFKLSFQKLIASENSKHYEYRIGIFQGRNYIDNTPPTLCSVFRCASNNVTDCNSDIPINTDVVFNNITIIANTTKGHDYLLERSSFTFNMSLFPTSDYEWHEYEENNYYGVRYVLNTTAANLHSFSVNATAKGTDSEDI